MITVIPIYLKYFVKQAMEACYFVASSEGSQPTLIWRPTHHSEATASANNAINFPAAAAAMMMMMMTVVVVVAAAAVVVVMLVVVVAMLMVMIKTNKNSPVLTVFLSPKVQVQ